MSDATFQAVQDALAAHIADEAEDMHVFLTDWQITAAAAIATDASQTMYFNVGSPSPYHSKLGLMYRGLEMLETGRGDDDDD